MLIHCARGTGWDGAWSLTLAVEIWAANWKNICERWIWSAPREGTKGGNMRGLANSILLSPISDKVLNISILVILFRSCSTIPCVLFLSWMFSAIMLLSSLLKTVLYRDITVQKWDIPQDAGKAPAIRKRLDIVDWWFSIRTKTVRFRSLLRGYQKLRCFSVVINGFKSNRWPRAAFSKLDISTTHYTCSSSKLENLEDKDQSWKYNWDGS